MQFIATLALAAIVASVPLVGHADERRQRVGAEATYKVVGVSTDLNVRAGPGTGFARVGRLLPGQADLRLKECSEHAGWCRVEAPGVNGWVASRYLAGMVDRVDREGRPLGASGQDEATPARLPSTSQTVAALPSEVVDIERADDLRRQRPPAW